MKNKIISHPDIYKFNESVTHEVYRYNDLLFKIYDDEIKFAIIKSYSDDLGTIEDSNGHFFRENQISKKEAIKLFPPSL